MADLDDLAADRWQPPPRPQSHLEFAARIKLPDGPSAGEQWNPASEPWQQRALEACDDPHWQVITIVAPSQRGKSLLGVLAPTLRALIECRQSVAYVMPTSKKLDEAWSGKVKPMWEGAGFAGYLPERGPGARGGRPAALTIRDPRTRQRLGQLFLLAAGGGGKETALASVTAPVVVVDEADDLADESHIGLAFRRTRSFGEAFRIFIVSTVNVRESRDGAHPILVYYARGTRSRLWYPCPSCGRHQPIEWESVKFDDADCGIQCQHCPHIWSEPERLAAIFRGVLVHDGQTVDEHGTVVGRATHTGRQFSLLVWDAECARASLPQIVAEYRAAAQAIDERGDHSAMRQFHHKVLCRDYRGDLDELEEIGALTWQGLLRRSQRPGIWSVSRHSDDRAETGARVYTYSRHIADLPPDAAFLAGGVDVQHDRVYWSLPAFAIDGTTWDVAWGYEYARADHDPWNTAELHALLDRVARIMREIAGERGLAPCGLDVGDFSDALWPWLQGKRDWRATKGASRTMKDEPGDLQGVAWHRDSLWLIDTDAVREMVHNAYRRPIDAAGSCRIPRLQNVATDTAYLKHLCAERIEIDPKTRKPRLKQGPGRWDWQDARRIAEVMGRLHLRSISKPPISKRRYGLIKEI